MVLDVQDWKDKIQTLLNKYQLAKHKECEEFTNSKHEIIVHDAELQVVEEKSEVEAQETEEKTRDETNDVDGT